jgi:TolB-like protein
MASKLSSLLAELKRRKVYHVAVTYAVVAAGTIGLANDALGQIWERLPLVVLVLFLIGFPIALVLAWAYEVRPEEPGRVDVGGAVPTEPSTAGNRKSIVVLPFDNMSPDPGDAYFADGLTEEIITHLSCCGLLRVISRNSAMVLKGTQKSTQAIAEELDVQYVLEGSVRKAGTELRITAQLIDAISDEHLWAEKYDGVLQDVFGMQESVSKSIVEALELRLTSAEEQRIGERRIEDVQAYQWYLKAQGEILSATPDALRRAQQYLDAAIEITGPNPYLFAGLALAQWQRANLGIAQEEALALGDDYLSKALALDPDLPLALALRGSIELMFRGNTQKAASLLKRALVANPNEPFALTLLAAAYVNYAGKTAAARPLVELLVRLDPLSVLTHWLLGAVPFFEGDFQKASVEWQRLCKVAPDVPLWRLGYALAVSYTGDRERALAILDDTGVPGGEDAGPRLYRMLKSALENDRGGALREITPEFRETLIRDGSWAHLAAAPLAFVGAVDESIDLLEHAVRRGGFINFPMLAEHDPFLAKLRGDPRYEALVAEAQERWEAFEV